MKPLTSTIRPFCWCIGIGVLLGAGISQLEYGAGGALILTVLIGSLSLIIASRTKRTASVFAFCFSLWGSFWIFGFQNISDPLSVYSIYALLGFVGIPVGVAAAITKISNSYALNRHATKQNED